MLDDSSSSPITPKPEVGWGVIMSVLVGFLALFGPALIATPLASIIELLPLSANVKQAVMHFILAGMMASVILVVLAAYGKHPRDIGLNRPRFSMAAKSLLALVVYIVLSLGAQLVAEHFFKLNTAEPQSLRFLAPSGAEVGIVFAMLVFLTPFAEELVFRGFMLTGFRRRLPFWAAAILVSALFGLVHGQWNVGLDVFIMSMVACYLVKTSQSLWPAIFLHMYKNAIAFYLIYLYNGS